MKNFDKLLTLFLKNIYKTNKGIIRVNILLENLSFLLNKKDKLIVMDLGGGEGFFSIQFAKMGHRVIYCDISIELLNRAKNQAKELQLEENITFFNCSIDELSTKMDEKADLVLCHAVLEWNENHFQFLEKIKAFLKPNGFFSLMFFNYYSLLFKNVLVGNFEYALLDLPKKKKRTLSPDFPAKPEIIFEMLKNLDFEIQLKSGIRIFYDYIENKERRDSHFSHLFELEKKYSMQEPYLQFARYIHVLSQLN